MKEKFIILNKNIRKRKMFSIIILMLSLFATMFLITSIGTVTNVQKLYDKSYDKSNTGDVFMGFIGDKYSEDYKEHFLKNEKVNQVNKDESLIGAINITEEESLNTIISVYDKEKHDYSIDTSNNTGFILKDNEVLIPSYFRDEYDLTLGDSIFYVSGKTKIDFKIAGFFEDPIFGSPFYETKRMLITNAYFEELKENQASNNLNSFYILNINLKDEYKGENFSESTTEIIDEFNEGTLSAFSLDRTFMTKVRLMVPKIISLLLIVFSAFFIIILTIVLRYTILATIETDFSSLGILKALGFKGRDLIHIFMIQFSIISLLGAVIGAIISYKIAGSVGEVLLSSSGIWWGGTINPLIGIIVISLLFIYVVTNVYLISNKIKSIKPVEAILLVRGEKKIAKGVSIEKGILKKMPLIIKIATKGVSSKFSQYSTLIVLCIILSFMISTIFGLNTAFNNEEKVSNLLGYPIYDVRIEINDSSIVGKEEIEKVLKNIDEEYSPKFITSEEVHTIEIDNTKVSLVVNSLFDSGNVVEGRIPDDANEIMITDGIRRLIGKDIGDFVELSMIKNSTNTQKYEIVGINNKVTELGKNISIRSSGYERLSSGYYPKKYYVKFDSNEGLDEKINLIKEKYGYSSSGINVSNARTDVIKTISMIQGALSKASLAVLIISGVLIMLIIILISIVVMAREVLNIGVLRSIGFTSKQVRMELVIRFIFVSFVGAFIGSVLNSFVGELIINSLFKIASISKVPTGVGILVYMYSILFVLGITVICSWIVSSRIKKVNTRVLLSE